MISIVKNIWVIFLLTLMVALVWFLFIPYIKALTGDSLSKLISIEAVSDEKRPFEVGVGTTTLELILAANESEREQGLGNQRFLPENRGMLFVFDQQGYPSIWMKDMFFSIDAAWLDNEFRIVDIKRNISPGTYPKSFQSDLPAKYVLEVNAGWFEYHHISLGDMLYLANKDNI